MSNLFLKNMKKIIQVILKVFARAILKKYRPEIVGITGSIGKTSTKEAVTTVLSGEFSVRSNIGNYNNEIGLPLTIIGATSAGKNIFKWLLTFAVALKLIIKKSKIYPEVLVLEMGADHPGDIKYLSDFVQCQVGIVTKVAPVHLEFFDTLENIAKEKSQLIRSLGKEGMAVLNADDAFVLAMAEKASARVLTYGVDNSEAMIHAVEVKASGQNLSRREGVESIRGVSFKIQYDGNTVPIFLPAVLGEPSVYAALAGVAVGIYFKINLIRIAESLKQYRGPRGRMNLIDGIKYTLIVDDTYNSSPMSVKSALAMVCQIRLPEKRLKYAVLGDMLELGNYSEKAHIEIGREVAECGFDYLITVGPLSQLTAKSALAAGMDRDHVFSFEKSGEVGRFLQERIEQGDLILVKGSQGMRMEKIVKEIMAEPLRAGELLVRQDEKWRGR